MNVMSWIQFCLLYLVHDLLVETSVHIPHKGQPPGSWREVGRISSLLEVNHKEKNTNEEKNALEVKPVQEWEKQHIGGSVQKVWCRRRDADRLNVSTSQTSSSVWNLTLLQQSRSNNYRDKGRYGSDYNILGRTITDLWLLWSSLLLNTVPLLYLPCILFLSHLPFLNVLVNITTWSFPH